MSGSESTPGGGEHSGPQPSRLVPGRMIGAGRYRLITLHGGTKGFQFWHAFDSTLQRDVALTVVPAGPGQAGVLDRTLRLGHVDSPGLARILDVVNVSPAEGIVVAEWTPGVSLREVADASASGSAHAVRALADAAELAHRSQVALAIDHPDRIRISSAGNAVLAFPAVPADAGPDADVRGVGAVLYALLTGTWALRDRAAHTDAESQTIGGLPVAPRDPSGAPLAPHTLRPEVDYPISILALRALDGGRGGLRTAGSVVNVIDQNLNSQQPESDPTVANTAVANPAVPATTTADAGAASASAANPAAEPTSPNGDGDKRKKFALIGGAVLAVALVVWGLSSVISGGELETNSPETSSSAESTTTSTNSSAVPPPAAPPQTTASSSQSPEPTSPPEVQGPPIEREPSSAPEQPAVQAPPPPPAPAPAPPRSDVLPCYAGYSHQPPPDGPCLPEGGGGAAPAPAPAPPAPPAPAPGPNELPCYPGYYHDPSRGGQCWAN